MIKPVQWKNRINFLTDEQVSQIHNATLQVLEKTGVKMPLPEDKLEKLQDLGLIYNRDMQRMHFPPGIVEAALKSVPSEYTLYARKPENDMPIDGKHGYLTTDGSATRFFDLETHELRDSTSKDLADLCIVADYVPQISFYWPSVAAREFTPAIQPLYELKTVLANTTKHVQAMTAVDPVNAQGTVDICRAVAGGAKAFKEKPFVSTFICSISPLEYERKGMEAAFIYAEAGVPTGFMPMQAGCSTAPATLAGVLVQGNAEILAGIIAMELLYPGAPTFYGSCATFMELHHGNVVCSSPNDYMLQAFCAQLARYYNMPSNIGTCSPGAKSTDWDCGMENSVSVAMSFLGNADMMCGAGLTNSGAIFSVEQMLLDCECYDMMLNTLGGMEVNEETLALDVIHAVNYGSGDKHYLNQKHTLRHLREIWQPIVSHRGNYNDWQKKGAKSSFMLANELARDILKKHDPEVKIDLAGIEQILSDYEKQAAL